MHTESHPLAGQTVILNDTAKDTHRNTVVPGAEFEIEDWWDKLTRGSWMEAEGNPAAMMFGFRSGFGGHLPIDDEVVYGKIGAFGHIVHVSELGEVKK